jgi:hypothetical protein
VEIDGSGVGTVVGSEERCCGSVEVCGTQWVTVTGGAVTAGGGEWRGLSAAVA